MVARGEGKGSGGEVAAGPQGKPPSEPWYRIAQEAAQILVSALALYGSIKTFTEKLRKRRDLKRQEEA